ncbi:MAG: beta-ketoacyl-ACP synthase II [Actinobacteria bacterium]|nr:beta-ketoacyl-ACP synthase II [Actinomycetota bacterium]
MQLRRAVITGLGVVSPIGVGVENFYKSLIEGRSGISFITRFDASNFPVKIAGEVKEDLSDYVSQKESKRLDLFSIFALAAAELALKDAGIDSFKDPYRVGAIVSSGIGGIGTIEEEHITMLNKGPQRVSPFLIPKIISNMASGNIAIRYGIKGPNFSIASACASSSHAIGIALDMIRMGKADVVLVGGTEAPITPLSVAGFSSLKALSTRNDEPEKASRPFDASRDGFVMAEGAAILIVEDEQHARKRGARIYCELAGYGFTDDAYHITQPDISGETAAYTMKMALEDAEMTVDDVDYINAHGTSTKFNDEIETKAIKLLFKERAYDVFVSSTKSMSGHLLGAAGAIEACATALGIFHGVAFPTINLDEPDPECDLNYVPHQPIELEIRGAISNSFGFGGHNAVIAFKKYV